MFQVYLTFHTSRGQVGNNASCAQKRLLSKKGFHVWRDIWDKNDQAWKDWRVTIQPCFLTVVDKNAFLDLCKMTRV